MEGKQVSEPLMTAADVQACRERADKATAGPWEQDETWLVHERGIWPDGSRKTLAEAKGFIKCDDANDAAFIASARSDVPRLCDDLLAARATIAAKDEWIADLEAKLVRLMGGYDVQGRIAELEDEVRRVESKVVAMEDELEESQAENERLKNRGIEDMKHRIAELEAEHAKCPVPVFNADCTVNELGRAIIAEQQKESLENRTP